MRQRCQVRVAPSFFDRLDELLPPERGPRGEPSTVDFLLHEMPTIIDGLAAGQRKAVAHVRGPDLVRSGARDQLLEDDDADEHDQERQIDPARSRNGAPDRSQHRLSEAEQDAIQRGRRSTRAGGNHEKIARPKRTRR